MLFYGFLTHVRSIKVNKMKKMKILLIYPPFPYGKGMSSIICSPPLNLLILAGAIPEHEVDILDLNVNKSHDIDKIKDKICKYDMVGITCMSSTLRLVLEICRIAKKNGVSTLLGGFHPSLDPKVIDNCDCIDMIIRGEGEFTFKELLSGKPKQEILGLSYRENGKVFHNPDRPFIENLNDLPFSRNELINPQPYHYAWLPAWVIETSRGCSFQCEFCCVNQFYNWTYRTKTPERVIQELFQVPLGVKVIFFVDDNFTLNKKRVLRICELIQKNNLHKKFLFVCQARVADMADNPELVHEMHQSGFVCVFLGVESLKQMALDRMKKGYSLEKVISCVNTCHENGILTFGSFIIGNIGETKKDVRKTFKMMKEIDFDFIMTMPITPFPGTKLAEEAMEKGWMSKDFSWEDVQIGESLPIMQTPDLSRKEIQELLSESYRSFYTDIKFFIKKFLSPKSPFQKHSKNFKWTRKHAFKFIKNGLTRFIFRLDTIVDDVYETA